MFRNGTHNSNLTKQIEKECFSILNNIVCIDEINYFIVRTIESVKKLIMINKFKYQFLLTKSSSLNELLYHKNNSNCILQKLHFHLGTIQLIMSLSTFYQLLQCIL